MSKSMSKYLKGIPSARLRTLIRKGARRRGFRLGRIGPAEKEILQDAIFEVENELESRGDGQPNHPHVVAMRRARNEVLTDLGWNASQAERSDKRQTRPALQPGREMVNV